MKAYLRLLIRDEGEAWQAFTDEGVSATARTPERAWDMLGESIFVGTGYDIEPGDETTARIVAMFQKG